MKGFLKQRPTPTWATGRARTQGRNGQEGPSLLVKGSAHLPILGMVGKLIQWGRGETEDPLKGIPDECLEEGLMGGGQRMEKREGDDACFPATAHRQCC